jgi:signal transduction histidine kinase
MDTALSHDAAIQLGEEQLRAERAEAEAKHQHKINKANEAFIATMSHELRTPLASIRAFADLLNRDTKGELSDRRKQQISVIRRNSEWLNILINDLLDLSSIDSGRFELQLKDVDLAEHLAAISESFIPIAEFSGHTLKTVLPKRSVMMRFNPNRVNQVLGNLLTNAMKYSSEGSEIRLLARPTHDGAWFYVRDHGPGIPADQHKSVFERFVRAKSKASKRRAATACTCRR